MSLRHLDAFSVHCDRCGVQFEDGDYTIFSADSDLNFDDHDWWEVGDGKAVEHFCGACHTSRWPSDEDPPGDDDDGPIHAVKPIPDPHPIVRNPRWTSPVASPGETCLAEGCGLRASHAVHSGASS